MDGTEARARAASLVDLIAEQAPAGEEQRRVPQAVIDAVDDADLFGLVVPTSLGGHGLGLDTLGDVTRTLAHGCTATAWTVSFLLMHGWLFSRFPEVGRDELFADGLPMAPAPLAPTGVATPVDGGFTVTGRWEWATGSAHAGWVLVHAIEDGPDFTTRFVALPIGDVTVEDVWFTSGMRATSSNTVVVDGAFVPAHRTAPAAEFMQPSPGVAGDGLAGLPVMAVLTLIAAAPALGAAEAAADVYRQRLRDRVLAYTLGDRAVEQPAAQIRLAAVDDLVALAGARWRQSIDAVRAGSVSEEVRVDARLAAASTVRLARQAVGTACEGAGASVYLSTHSLQRIQRDVETLKGHVLFDWDRTAELAGRYRLGFDLRLTDMV